MILESGLIHLLRAVQLVVDVFFPSKSLQLDPIVVLDITHTNLISALSEEKKNSYGWWQSRSLQLFFKMWNDLSSRY